MNRSQFRWLLTAYVLFVVIDLAVSSLTKSMIPDLVIQAQHSALRARFAPHGISAVALAIAGGLVITAIVALVGIVGMFCFWRPGFYMFFGSVLVRIISCSILWPWHVETGWTGLVGSIGTVLEGLIFALVFFGPAKSLFWLHTGPTKSSLSPGKPAQADL